MSNFYYFFIEKYNTEIVVYFNLLKEKGVYLEKKKKNVIFKSLKVE